MLESLLKTKLDFDIPTEWRYGAVNFIHERSDEELVEILRIVVGECAVRLSGSSYPSLEGYGHMVDRVWDLFKESL